MSRLADATAITTKIQFHAVRLSSGLQNDSLERDRKNHHVTAHSLAEA